MFPFHSFFEDAPLMECIYLVLTRMLGGITVGDSGLCCYVPCPSSGIISLCLLIHCLRRHRKKLSDLILNTQSTAQVVSGRNIFIKSKEKRKKRCPIRSSLLFMFEEVWEKKKKLNEPGRQKLEGQNSFQQAKNGKPYNYSG